MNGQPQLPRSLIAYGVREGNGMKLYLAYLRDPDGNKL